MSVDLKNAFRLSFVTERTELPIPAASQILARLRSGPVWDGASIAPADAQFPLLRVDSRWGSWSRRRVDNVLRGQLNRWADQATTS